jgi:hypothetical protein
MPALAVDAFPFQAIVRALLHASTQDPERPFPRIAPDELFLRSLRTQYPANFPPPRRGVRVKPTPFAIDTDPVTIRSPDQVRETWLANKARRAEADALRAARHLHAPPPSTLKPTSLRSGIVLPVAPCCHATRASTAPESREVSSCIQFGQPILSTPQLSKNLQPFPVLSFSNLPRM